MPNEIPIPNNDQGPPGGTETGTGTGTPSYTIPETEFCVYGKPIKPPFDSPFSQIIALQNPSINPSPRTQVYAHPQHASALALVYEETTRLSASEPGVIYYCISRESDDSGRGGGDSRVFHFFERFTGREAFEAHSRQPIIRKLLEEDGYIERVEAVFVKPLA
ncbi:hypothetical protein N0V85_000650 [Neurospora sp. IMI 360204]|nr:hypothetical protein N0V85_000650 [Neurospora sp. IMI 360204]